MGLRLPNFSDLDERIDILNVTAPYDANGNGTIVSVAAANIWASVEPLGGDLGAITQNLQQCTQAYRVWIRSRTGLEPWQQIRWGDKRLVISGPLEDFESRFTLIHAEEKTSRSLSRPNPV
jgi:head-tail adaptor